MYINENVDIIYEIELELFKKLICIIIFYISIKNF